MRFCTFHNLQINILILVNILFAVIMHTYKWLICWLAKATKEKMEKLKAFEMDRFKIRNLCQVYKARSLSLVFSEVGNFIFCVLHFMAM